MQNRQRTSIPRRATAEQLPTHRAGFHSGLHPDDEPYLTDQRERYLKNPLNLADDLDYPEERTRTPTSAVRYDKPPRWQPTTQSDPKKTRVIQQRRFDRTTFVIWACLLFMVMIGGWWLFSFVSNWWTGVQDDWKYGNPRTYQIDQFVGQGDSPDHPDHFIVVNTHSQIIVVQINPQHPNLNRMYGITTTSDPKTPVSLSFRQMGNTLAMYVIIGDTTPYTVELVSNGKQFVGPH